MLSLEWGQKLYLACRQLGERPWPPAVSTSALPAQLGAGCLGVGFLAHLSLPGGLVTPSAPRSRPLHILQLAAGGSAGVSTSLRGLPAQVGAELCHPPSGGHSACSLGDGKLVGSLASENQLIAPPGHGNRDRLSTWLPDMALPCHCHSRWRPDAGQGLTFPGQPLPTPQVHISPTCVVSSSSTSSMGEPCDPQCTGGRQQLSPNMPPLEFHCGPSIEPDSAGHEEAAQASSHESAGLVFRLLMTKQRARY